MVLLWRTSFLDTFYVLYFNHHTHDKLQIFHLTTINTHTCNIQIDPVQTGPCIIKHYGSVFYGKNGVLRTFSNFECYKTLQPYWTGFFVRILQKNFTDPFRSVKQHFEICGMLFVNLMIYMPNILILKVRPSQVLLNAESEFFKNIFLLENICKDR